jgi:hypothetical protein
MANLSWEFYNERAGMELCALLLIVEPDANWPGAGYKPGSDEHKDLKRYAASEFPAFIRKYGAAKWGSTERGEHKHHWMKIWWRETNGRNIDGALLQA